VKGQCYGLTNLWCTFIFVKFIVTHALQNWSSITMFT